MTRPALHPLRSTVTPHHLHALAAAYSLQAARTRLAELAAAEARRNTDSLMAAAPISAPIYGTRHAIGSHADPVGGTLLAGGRPVQVTTWADLLRRSDGRLGWICGQLPGPVTVADYIGHILDRLPALLPGTAAVLARHLADEDAWVRDAIGQPRPVQPLPGIACPHCDERTLVVQTAGPVEAWTVVCATGRVCIGQGCWCGMPGRVEGVAHIWPRAVVLGGTLTDAR